MQEKLPSQTERQILDRNTFDFLRPGDARTSRLYILPKIHKDIPGRLIVSSCGTPTKNISLFVDYHLHPLVKKIPSYIKDTNDFLVKLNEIQNLPSECLLVTSDASSLYTNIPLEEGMEACREALDTRDVLDSPTDDVVHLISLILKKNSFSFNGENYIQKHGTVIGTQMAASFANIFMGKLERNILHQATHKPTIWWRDIDDIFPVWTHGEDKLIKFMDDINGYHRNVTNLPQRS